MLSLQSADEVKEYVSEYVGSSNAAQKFANEFVRQREFEIGNAQTTTAFNGSGQQQQPQAGSGTPQSGKKSSKKKMQKMDPNLLGFVTPPIQEYTSD